MKKNKKKFTFFWEEPLDDINKFGEQLEEKMHRAFADVDMPFTFQFRMPRMKFFRGIRIGEHEKEIIVLAELPGFDKNDIDVEVGEDFVHIKAQKKIKKTEKDLFRSFVSNVDKRVSLPKHVLPEKAKATMEHGILKLVLPKAHIPAKKRKLKIE
ncbi:MAG: hypothetical protein DRP08_00030 [Candidatus Aenigmatarchaeota archaeon]|nr:MAG: hypothetical protein DRP08_00030 [Candidatus Aenigmarchaeota archaeon]